MTDRSDGVMTGAFISRLRPGRFFKDLIEHQFASMEDLFTQSHNFIRADEANTAIGQRIEEKKSKVPRTIKMDDDDDVDGGGDHDDCDLMRTDIFWSKKKTGIITD
ncbi:hypothetical protein Tco_1059643 [Tanacetum coccineum]